MNVLTFDIEDWFHIFDHDSTRSEKGWGSFPSRIDEGIDRILELLATRNVNATFFCLGWVAEYHPAVIRRIDAEGHEVATHSYAHQLAHEQSPTEFEADLKRSVETLEDLIGKKIRAYRAPGFSITSSNTWVFDILCRNGIEIDCSVFPAIRSYGGFPEFGDSRPAWIECEEGRIKELPVNVRSFLHRSLIFSGGGYFRLFPYWWINKLMSRADYVMSYFHPRDFDVDQPVIPGLSLTRRFKTYYGLSGAFNKLGKLLEDFEFMDLRTADQAIDWEAAPVFKVQEMRVSSS